MQLEDQKYCEYEQHYNDSVTLLPKENCLKHLQVVKDYPDAGIEARDNWAKIAKKTGNAEFCEYHAGETKNRMDFCLEGIKEIHGSIPEKSDIIPIINENEKNDDSDFTGEWF